MEKKVRLKDLRALALRVKNITDELKDRVSALEGFAESILSLTNSVIDNIERGENS